MKVIEFEEPMLMQNFFVCICSTIKELFKHFKNEDFSDFDDKHLGYAFGATHNDKKYRRVIWLRRWDVSIFIHEAYHISCNILDSLEIKDQETGAYLMEFIYRQTKKGFK